jgi:ferredoxin
MAYVITGACVCVKDKTCVGVCPVDCILAADEDPMLFIDPTLCIDCAACEPVCPVKAIYRENAVPAEMRDYIDINRSYFSDRPATLLRVQALTTSKA